MKKPADAILASLSSDDDDEMDEESESSGSDEKKRAAGEEFASALKSGDGLKIASALDDLLACCGY
jgi:hypothetical protein